MALSDDVKSFIANASGRFGISQRYLSTTALFESGGDVNAKTGSAQGLFQFMPSTGARYGLDDPFDGQASAYAAANLASDNRSFLQKALGRDVTDAETYLAHQQGAGGALALLTHGSERAASLVGTAAITGNGGNANMTASEFVNMITGKYNKLESGVSDVSDSTAQTGADGKPWKADTSQSSIEHILVRGTVIILGFIFVGVGLMMFRNPLQDTVAGDVVNYKFGPRIRHEGEVSLVQQAPLESVPPIAPPDNGGGGGTVSEFLRALNAGPAKGATEALPKAREVNSGFISRKTSKAKLPPVLTPSAAEDKRGEGEVDFAFRSTTDKGFMSFIEGKPQSTPEEKDALFIEYFPKAKRSKEIRMAGVREMQNSGSEGGMKSLVDDVQAALLAPLEVVKSAKKVATRKASGKKAASVVPAIANDADAAVAQARQNAPTVDADEVARLLKGTPAAPAKVETIGELKPGKTVKLLDPEGVGRTDEPFKVLELWTDPKHGAFAKIEGTHSGTSFFPVKDLEMLEKGVMSSIGTKGPTHGVARRALAALRKSQKALKGDKT